MVLPGLERMLGPRTGEPQPLVTGTSAGRSQVFRVPVEGATVVVKRVEPFEPDATASGTPSAFFLNDWAGQQFLSELGCGLSPRFLGGDAEHGMFVLEDVGDAPSLADLLLGTDPYACVAGLESYALGLARLHAATSGRFEEYRRLRRSLGASSDGYAVPASGGLRESLAAISEATGVAVPAGAADECERIEATLADPGPQLAYRPSDTCPDNNRIVGDSVRFFDFEGGGFRHALLDVAYLRSAFPTCWCVNRLPSDVVRDAEEVYRAEAGLEVDAFAHGLALCSAAWLLWTTRDMIPSALERDVQHGPRSAPPVLTRRQCVLLRLELFARDEVLPALADFASVLRDSLGARWTDTAVAPLYRPFR